MPEQTALQTVETAQGVEVRKRGHVANTEAEQMLSMIERMIMDPNISIEKVERMFALKEKHDAQVAFSAYSAAMSLAQKEMGIVAKNKNNSHTKSNYADLAAIDNSIRPVYTRHGLSLSFSNEQIDGEKVKVKCIVAHERGHRETFELVGELDGAGLKGNSNKTGIQAMGSTISYLRRYLTMMVFNIATSDDLDGVQPNSATTITDEQASIILDLLEDIEVDESRIPGFCKRWEIESLNRLPSIHFNRAVAEIRHYNKKHLENV